MQFDLELGGQLVVVVGGPEAVCHARRRLRAADAHVLGLLTCELPAEAADWLRRCPQPTERSALLRALAPAALVILAEVDAELACIVRELCGHLGVPLSVARRAVAPGTVTLVGGGPGGLGLITADGLAALRDADVIFADRLAPVSGLAAIAPTAEIVDVGKHPFHHPVSQDRIEAMLIDRARSGQAVVRLKGGDPYVFGRGSEEVRSCLAAGVPVRVIPGVSSAIAVPGRAGIPLTHRGVSRAFSVISGHVPLSAVELEALARLGGTIVILMGVDTLTQLAVGLQRAGLPADTPAAIIERGFSDSQRTTHARLDQLADQARRLAVSAPAVVVIGEVVRLAQHDASALGGELAELGGIGA